MRKILFNTIKLLIIGCFSFTAFFNNLQRVNKNYSYNTYKPYVAENGSYKGQYSYKTFRQKDTYVKGYHRKDGAYVRSHYRSKKR